MSNTKKMTNVASVLETKASDLIDVQEDLNNPEGKAIAELLNDQENQETKPDTTTK